MSELPRVLLCAFEVVPSPTSVSRRVTEYLRALGGGFNLDVITLKPPDLSHIEKLHGARLLRVPVGTGPLPERVDAFERALRRQLASEEYALVHFGDPFAGQPLCERKHELGYRVLYDAISFPSQELRFTHPELATDPRFLAKVRRQELSCLMAADVVVTGSASAARAVQGLGVPSDALRILRTPAEATPRRPASGGPLRIVYAGSLLPWQGLATAIRAMPHVLGRTPARLRLIGPSHPVFEPQLRRLVSELRLESTVEFSPPVPVEALPHALADADVGLLPIDDVERHRTGSAPLTKVADYLAAGLPILASDLPLTRELVPQTAARFFRAGDPLALAEQLVALAADGPARTTLSAAARDEARSTLDPRRFAQVALDLYEELLGVTAADVGADAGTGTLGATPTTKVPEFTAPGTPGPRWAADRGWKSRAAPQHDWTPTSVRLQLAAEEPEEISNEEIQEAAEDHPAAAAQPATGPTSRRGDPWLTQLLHGYCPPDGAQFGRPTPPAQFVGREMSPAGGVPALPPASPTGRPDGTKP